MLAQAVSKSNYFKEGFTHGDLDEGQMLKLPASSGETEGKWALSDLKLLLTRHVI